MLHRIILVLTLLVAVGCTGDDTVIRETFCPTLDRVLMEDETCPDPDPPPVVTTPPPPTTTPDPDTDRGAPTRSDCNIQVQGATLDGTTEDDVICGNDRDNTIDGKTGDDTIYGGPGNDTLIGGNDRDTLRGEAGNDTLRGGQDNDILDGGAGTDTADYSMENLNADGTALEEGVEGVDVNLAENHARDTYGDDDRLENIENVKGTLGEDTITGDEGSNHLDGHGGNDAINGGAGNDSIVYDSTDVSTPVDVDGGAGEDTLIVGASATLGEVGTTGGTGTEGTVGFENLQAEAGTTEIDLTGNSKDNKLIGNDANNDLTGGEGNDMLTGGKGTDCFALNATTTDKNNNADKAKEITATTDTITDYEEGETIAITAGVTDLSDENIGISGGTITVIIRAIDANPDDDPPTVAQSKRSPVLARVRGSGASKFTRANLATTCQ